MLCTHLLETTVNAAIKLHIEIWIQSARMQDTAVQHRSNMLSHACTALRQGAIVRATFMKFIPQRLLEPEATKGRPTTQGNPPLGNSANGGTPKASHLEMARTRGIGERIRECCNRTGGGVGG